MENKKIIIIVVITILVTAGAVYLYLNNRQQRLTEQAIAELPAVEKANVDFTRLPSRFPTDLPIEPDAKTTQNYNSTTADGHFQATRAYESNKSLDESFNIYSKYLKEKGWTIAATTEEPDYKMVLGKKGKENIQVSIGENLSKQIKTVTITYSEIK